VPGVQRGGARETSCAANGGNTRALRAHGWHWVNNAPTDARVIDPGREKSRCANAPPHRRGAFAHPARSHRALVHRPGREGRYRSLSCLATIAAIVRPIVIDAVAAGDGAFSTCTERAASTRWKSSRRAPPGPTACARTPARR